MLDKIFIHGTLCNKIYRECNPNMGCIHNERTLSLCVNRNADREEASLPFTGTTFAHGSSPGMSAWSGERTSDPRCPSNQPVGKCHNSLSTSHTSTSVSFLTAAIWIFPPMAFLARVRWIGVWQPCLRKISERQRESFESSFVRLPNAWESQMKGSLRWVSVASNRWCIRMCGEFL